MEKIFERYVADCLTRGLANNVSMIRQAASEHLCLHEKSKWFELHPDPLMIHGARRWILDTKWKRLDQSLRGAKDKHGMDQDDMYQMFAYGHRYLNGRGEMLLIYPKTQAFSMTLGPFEFSKDLKLWAVPFDLAAGRIVEECIPDDLKAVIRVPARAVN
jgi:5-methylcytosine-specific restriction enzyme subunit McrC